MGNILKFKNHTLDFSNGCILMGILNITPDSFSDGQLYLDHDAAVKHGIQMAKDGAAMIDIGPESSRPGAEPVSPAEQIERAIPVIKELSKQVNVPISIDTTDPQVAAAAINAGASIINDITALADNDMAKLAAKEKTLVILMHMLKKPQTMQQDPQYKNVVTEVRDFLLERAANAQKFGIPKDHTLLDPGIGFGKTLDHNLTLLKNIDAFVNTDYRVLIGTSRKAFLGLITGKQNPADRDLATAATVVHCALKGVSIARVHNIPLTAEVLKICFCLRK